MSCYDWEAGTIKLPTAVFSTFRRELNVFCNQRQTLLFNKALCAFEKMGARPMPKGPLDLAQDILELLKESRYSRVSGWESGVCDGVDEIVQVLMPRPTGKLHKPQKKDFPLCALTCSLISFGEWSIVFEPKAHTVRWAVAENNHACERAHEHAVVERFFKMLREVKWVRGTGGEIAGNNEYGRDSRDVGGGSNSANFTFAPKTIPARASLMPRIPLVMRRSRW